MIALVVGLVVTCVEVGGHDVCLANQEKSHFNNLRNQLKGVENTISYLEKGLKGKHVFANSGCRKDWKRFRDHCYYISKQRTSWFEAERHCRAEGSSLSSINDDNENNWIKSKLKEANIGCAWIGATDCESGKWIWVSNFAPVKYFKWKSNEPNGGTDENCIEMRPSGLWNDRSCKVTTYFICKRHVKNGCPSKKD
ncbi:CD209 antigen-like protein C [Mytilus californianus]|uniref:CD209 antigen-like protein C n=1 Tax=Mytilus californianus TaxID=6549 RepID=UPI002247F8D2|nr:CD209 antigen-like protein C [Mytilus californianus]